MCHLSRGHLVRIPPAGGFFQRATSPSGTRAFVQAMPSSVWLTNTILGLGHHPKGGRQFRRTAPPEVLGLLGTLEEVIQADSGLGRAFIVEIYPRP